jgi:hypothetical protein
VLGVEQCTVGVEEVPGKEGTGCDAEDVSLPGDAVGQGSVDFVVALHLSTICHSRSRTVWVLNS